MDCGFLCKYLEKCGLCGLDGAECDTDTCPKAGDCEVCRKSESCYEQ